jgi:hypothetical protein
VNPAQLHVDFRAAVELKNHECKAMMEENEANPAVISVGN